MHQHTGLTPGGQQSAQAQMRAAQESIYANKASDSPMEDSRLLPALVSSLRDVRNRAHMAVTNLDGFLQRVTGECALPPAVPSAGQVAANVSPVHEAARLLDEILSTLDTLSSIQSRVDRIA